MFNFSHTMCTYHLRRHIYRIHRRHFILTKIASFPAKWPIKALQQPFQHDLTLKWGVIFFCKLGQCLQLHQQETLKIYSMWNHTKDYLGWPRHNLFVGIAIKQRILKMGLKQLFEEEKLPIVQYLIDASHYAGYSWRHRLNIEWKEYSGNTYINRWLPCGWGFLPSLPRASW